MGGTIVATRIKTLYLCFSIWVLFNLALLLLLVHCDSLVAPTSLVIYLSYNLHEGLSSKLCGFMFVFIVAQKKCLRCSSSRINLCCVIFIRILIYSWFLCPQNLYHPLSEVVNKLRHIKSKGDNYNISKSQPQFVFHTHWRNKTY